MLLRSTSISDLYLTFKKIPNIKLNQINHLSPDQLHTTRTIEIVKKVYKEDMKLFGYK